MIHVISTFGELLITSLGFQQHLLLSFVVLSACYFYVNDKRFTRRHESVLKAIWNELCEYFNQNSVFLFKLVAPKAMTDGMNEKSPKPTLQCERLEVTVGPSRKNYTFLPDVYSTSERPDIVIWSPKL